MAGIFAFTTGSDFERSAAKADVLAGKMALYPWQQPRLLPLPAHGLILGAIVNTNHAWPAEGAAWTEGALTCVVEGYFLRSLEACGADALIAQCRFAQASIAAYRKFGSDFPAKLEGAFTVLLHDADAGVLVAGNGRFASSHLYHRRRGGDVFYCTQLGPMAGCGLFEPRPDHVAVGHLLSDMQVFGTETVIEDVRCMEPATVHRIDLKTGEFTGRAYWTFGAVGEHDRSRSFDQHLDLVCEAVSAAGRKMMSRPGRYVSGLSGGLDSRLVAALAVQSRPDMKSWTFGADGAPDLVVAAHVSRVLGVEHLIYPTHPELVPQYAQEYAATVDGSISVDFAYGLKRTHALMHEGDVVLNGFAGEVVLGGYLLGPKPHILKRNLKAGKIFGDDVTKPFLDWNTTDEAIIGYIAAKAGKPSALTPYLAAKPLPIRERIAADVAAMAADVPLLFRAEHYFLANRVTRWTLMGIISDRNFYSDGSLFYDYDVIDRCMATPHAMRRENRLYSGVFKKLVPEMGAIVNVNNGLRADAAPWRSLSNKVTRGLGNKLRRRPASTQVTGNDPNAWSRHTYPDFYRELFRDHRTLERPFWDGPGLAKLFEKQLSGEVSAGAAFGQLASLELFCRLWLD